jgi:hypothetical protein
MVDAQCPFKYLNPNIHLKVYTAANMLTRYAAKCANMYHIRIVNERDVISESSEYSLQYWLKKHTPIRSLK